MASGRAVERFRLHSEGDDDEKSDDDSFPLPDIIRYHRDRSQSEPAVPAWQRTETERRFGQELRRISDEFHDSYVSARQGRNRNQNMPRPSSYPGTQGGEPRPFWQQIWRYFSRQQQQQQQPTEAQPGRGGRQRSSSTSSLWE